MALNRRSFGKFKCKRIFEKIVKRRYLTTYRSYKDESNKLLFAFVGSIGGEISPFNDFFKDPKSNSNPNWTEPVFSVQARFQTRTVPFGALGDGDGDVNGDDGYNRGEIIMMEWLWMQDNNIIWEVINGWNDE